MSVLASDIIPMIVIMLVGMVCLYQLFLLSGNTSKSSLSFKTYDLPVSRSFQGYGWDRKEKLLIAAGMRKKLVINVYAVGLYISSSKEKELKKAGKKFNSKLSTSSSESIGSAIVLKFQMNVGTNKVVTAIVDALPGKSRAYKESLSKFQKLLLDGLGSGGAKSGDVVEFIFRGKDEIGVGVRGSVVGYVKSVELRQKLMDVYAGDKSVAPEVNKILKSTFI